MLSTTATRSFIAPSNHTIFEGRLEGLLNLAPFNSCAHYFPSGLHFLICKCRKCTNFSHKGDVKSICFYFIINHAMLEAATIRMELPWVSVLVAVRTDWALVITLDGTNCLGYYLILLISHVIPLWASLKSYAQTFRLECRQKRLIPVTALRQLFAW